MLKLTAYHEMHRKCVQEDYPEMIETFLEREQDENLRVTLHVLRGKSRTFSKVLKAFNSVPEAKEILNKGFPMACVTADPTKVKVFPNLPMKDLEAIDPKDASLVTVYSCAELYLPTFAQIKEESAHAQKKKRWDSKARTLKTLTHFNVMTWDRYLTRYVFKGEEKKSTVIRDLSLKLQASLLPPQIQWAASPQDYIDMYESGPRSCMTTRSGDAKAWAELLAEAGFHPTTFYQYHPLAQGVRLIKEGNTAARAICWKNNKGKPEGYTRVYQANDESGKQLRDAMEEEGYRSLSSVPDLSSKTSFQIKGVWSDSHKDFLLPLPYIDSFGHKLHAVFDIPSKTFILNSKDGEQVSLGSTSGYIKAKGILSKHKCASCGKTTNATTPYLTTSDRNVMCGSGCARTAGYVTVRQTDGNIVWKLHEDTFVKDSMQEYMHSSMYAMEKRYGKDMVYPVATTSRDLLDHKPCDDYYTGSPRNLVQYGGITYSMDNTAFSRLKKSSLWKHKKKGTITTLWRVEPEVEVEHEIDW